MLRRFAPLLLLSLLMALAPKQKITRAADLPVFDITSALKPGANALDVNVTNLWVNRLIGDQQPGVTKYTFTVAPTYKADAPFRPSGLPGHITIAQVSVAQR